MDNALEMFIGMAEGLGMDVEQDNEGQIIIYTGLSFDENNQVIDFEAE